MSELATVPLPYAGADITPDGLYRYRLWRIWDAKLPRICFVMLNPSTADAREDDKTIRRCIGFAKSMGGGGLEVVNLFGWRATKPERLWHAWAMGADIVGPDNAEHQTVAFRNCSTVICGWGAVGHRPAAEASGRAVQSRIRDAGRTPLALGLTQANDPRHPLYLAKTCVANPWSKY